MYKLPEMPREPVYDESKGEIRYKSAKRMIDVRGVEEIHTELIHNQYGLAVKSGGFIRFEDFDYVRVS